MPVPRSRSLTLLITSVATLPLALSAAVVPAHATDDGTTEVSVWQKTAEDFISGPYGDGMTALYLGVYDPASGWTYGAFGESAPGVVAQPSDHFPIGSITKTVLATAVLQHVEQGDLSLDDTVADLNPGLARKYPSISRWTVRQLLGMTTTIPDYADPALDRLIADPALKFTRDELISIGLTEGKPLPKVGGYSTTNYIILGDLMKKVTGKSPSRLVNEIFAAEGMADSYLGSLGTRPEVATQGYIGNMYGDHAQGINPNVTATTDVNTANGQWYMTFGREGGGAYATLPDLGTWAKSCVGNNLLDKTTVTEREQTTDINAGAYGLGIINEGDWWGHTGQVLGYEALAVCNPDTGRAVALAVNSSSGLQNAIGAMGQVAFIDYATAWITAQLT